jgi:glycosyltransferase involved in cell wall biosynthesis
MDSLGIKAAICFKKYKVNFYLGHVTIPKDLAKNMTAQLINARDSKKPLISMPPLKECEVCVIVPVKDEADTLQSTLESLATQIGLTGKPLSRLRYEIIVLANNCSDQSALIARRFSKQHPLLALHVAEIFLPPEKAYIGYVRKLLMDEAYSRLMSLGRKRGVIASTDGDTKVSPTWIASTLYEIDCGVDAVGGRIITDQQSRHALSHRAKTFFLQEVGYRSLVAEMEFYLDPDPYDPLPRHFQHYGASLAVTAEMYAQAGGLPPVRTPEDEAFYQSLLRANARFRHSPLVQVTTSARESGRSPVGLANQLRKWTEMSPDLPFEVESADAVISRFQSRRKLRFMWQKLSNGYNFSLREVEPLASKLGVSGYWLLEELLQSQTFGGLFETIMQNQQKSYSNCWQLSDIKIAIGDLRKYIAKIHHNTV